MIKQANACIQPLPLGCASRKSARMMEAAHGLNVVFRKSVAAKTHLTGWKVRYVDGLAQLLENLLHLLLIEAA